jgi:thymidylate kinase
MCVAILGADGAGKSTLIDTLRTDSLARAFSGVDVHHFAPALLRRSHGAVTAPHARPARGLAPSVVKALYWGIIFSAGYHLTVRPALARSRLVIFDRYLADAIVDPRRYRYGGPAWLLRRVWQICPKPDLVILLDVPPQQLQERKQEVAFAEAVRQSEAYRSLVGGLSMGRIVASGTPEEVARRVHALIAETPRGSAALLAVEP